MTPPSEMDLETDPDFDPETRPKSLLERRLDKLPVQLHLLEHSFERQQQVSSVIL